MAITKSTSKPNIKPANFKRTKIIATIGPVSMNYETISKLLKAGVNGFRLNFSHGTHQEKAEQIGWIRKASKEFGKPVAIIQDLQGPKIRLGDFEGAIPIKTGQEIRLGYKADYDRTGVLPVQYDISKRINRGERLYLFDGRIKGIVTSVQQGVVFVRAENSGVLIARKGINLPDTDFEGQVITKKDLKDMAFGATQDIDYVALSFVQTEDDIQDVRKKLRNLGSSARIISKLETRAASERLEAIVEASDIVMIARGDLAYEVGPEAVPLIQRSCIELCKKHSKQSIVATQMLISMVDEPEPSRAEVSDVSTAVLLGADCIMLSDETTVGKYPVEAVATMKRIARYNETHHPLHYQPGVEDKPGRQVAICKAIVGLAEQVRATAIVAETKSGATAYQISSHRPGMAVIAVTSSEQVANQLALTRGVKSFVRRDGKMQARKLTQWLKDSKVLKKGDVIVSASGKYPGVVGTTDTIKVRILD